MSDLEKNVKWFADVGMAQIYSNGLEYAFFNGQNEQCHAFAYCKDFLQDAIMATVNESKASIYGFTYEHGKNPPLDMEITRMGLRNKGDADFVAKCERSLTFMRELEEAMGFEPSELRSVGCFQDGADEVVVFDSDKRWMHSPVLISLYSLALRVGMTYEGGGWREHFEGAKSYLGSHDKSYTASAKTALDKIVGKEVGEVFAPKMEDNYPADCAISGMHNNSGIVAFAKGNINAKVKSKWSGE